MTTGLRILVVDDNLDAAGSLAALLELDGHDVRIASDGPQALELARTFTPFCVLLDIGMPGMDGRDVARALRAAHGSDLVLIAVTGWGDADMRTSSAFVDFDHYLRKPVDTNLLARIISPE